MIAGAGRWSTARPDRLQLVDVPIDGAQARSQLLRSAQSDRCTFQIHQRRITPHRPWLLEAQAPVRQNQAMLALQRMLLAPLGQPLASTPQRTHQGRPTPGTQLCQPRLQRSAGLEPLPGPLRRTACRRNQRHVRALAVGLIEHSLQQAFTCTQRAVPASGRRAIDDHQPQRGGRRQPLAPLQLGTAARAPAGKRCRPIDAPAPATCASLATRAGAQGFFGQPGRLRRGPLA